MNGFCIDTSVLINLKHYFRETFTGLWGDLETLITNGGIVAPLEVLRELESHENKDDEITQWAKRQNNLFRDFEPNLQLETRRIEQTYPAISGYQKMGPHADPWIIALAKLEMRIVVTNESEKNPLALNKIPHICQAEKIQSMDFRRFLQALGKKY